MEPYGNTIQWLIAADFEIHRNALTGTAAIVEHHSSGTTDRPTIGEKTP
jgi:hypothetical protein